MARFSTTGEATIKDVAKRHALSEDSVKHLLEALQRGGGAMAQFQCSEFGNGQWMQGGMTMVGDMFNHGLKAKVNAVLSELATAMSAQELFDSTPSAKSDPASSGTWWPLDLGVPSSSGSQNQMRYAIFPSLCRMAIDRNGEVTVYDTGTHKIGGVSQQQGSSSKLEFSSQLGIFPAESLPVISGPGKESLGSAQPAEGKRDGILDVAETLRKLADLHSQGLITDDEFAAKRKQVIDRI
ncbi:SHOCT domain-containing protein [Luteolibacter soli]|uniref:SHOCT domain-containing protein n=1 Tax=Luteolibacter soli TaxID=3135280 RepID=A0ABU9B5V5_9BACT